MMPGTDRTQNRVPALPVSNTLSFNTHLTDPETKARRGQVFPLDYKANESWRRGGSENSQVWGSGPGLGPAVLGDKAFQLVPLSGVLTFSNLVGTSS